MDSHSDLNLSVPLVSTGKTGMIIPPSVWTGSCVGQGLPLPVYVLYSTLHAGPELGWGLSYLLNANSGKKTEVGRGEH